MQRSWPELGFLDRVTVHQGYGTRQIGDTTYPSKDTMEVLLRRFEPRVIWKTVIASNLAFQPLMEMKTWEERVVWVNSHIEIFDQLFSEKDVKNALTGSVDLILFDALDRLASDWRDDPNPCARVAVACSDYRACQNIRLKVFLRTDMAQDSSIYQFQDASNSRHDQCH